MRASIAAAAVLIVVGIGAVAFVLFDPLAPGASEVTYRTIEATTADVVDAAEASGSIVAAATYDLAFGSAPVVTGATGSSTAGTGSTASSGSGATGSVDWPVTAVGVAVGDIVEAGAVLATADTTGAELQLRIATADLESARARLATDLSGADSATRAAARSSVDQATLQLSQATQAQSDTKRENALSVSQAKAAVTEASAQLAADTAAGAPDAVISADEKALSQAKQALASAESRATTSNHQAANQVASARLSVTRAQQDYATKVAPADDATLAADEAAVATAEAALADAQAALDQATLVAPVAGRITAVNVVAGSNAPSGTAIQLQSSELAVTASFTEDEILSIAIGQTATVAITATGGSVSGTVVAISPTASGTGGSSVVSFAVTIALVEGGDADTITTGAASPSPDPLPGMSAEVAVTLAEVDDVVAIPAIAVSGTSGSYSVQVLGSTGAVETRVVEVGLMTDSLAEIRSGLTVGEAVVTGTSADQVTTTTDGGNGRGLFDAGGGLGPGGGFQAPPGGFPGSGD